VVGVPKSTFWRTASSGGWNEPGDVTPRHRGFQEQVWFPFITECKNYKKMDLLGEILKDNKSSKIRAWWKQCFDEQIKAQMLGYNFSIIKKLLIIKLDNCPIYTVYDPIELSEVEKGIHKYVTIVLPDLPSAKLVTWEDFSTHVTRNSLEIAYREVAEGIR